MIPIKKTLRTAILTASIALIVAAAPALADPPTLTGAWEAVAKDDATGNEDRFVSTFSSDGTWISDGSTTGTSAAHGAWEKTGPRTFATKNVVFIYDQNGGLALIGRGRSELEVSQDGQSHSGVFEAEISVPGGPVLVTTSGTVSAERITVD